MRKNWSSRLAGCARRKREKAVWIGRQQVMRLEGTLGGAISKFVHAQVVVDVSNICMPVAAIPII